MGSGVLRLNPSVKLGKGHGISSSDSKLALGKAQLLSGSGWCLRHRRGRKGN